MRVMNFTTSALDVGLGLMVVGLWLLYAVLHIIDRIRERRRD